MLNSNEVKEAMKKLMNDDMVPSNNFKKSPEALAEEYSDYIGYDYDKIPEVIPSDILEEFLDELRKYRSKQARK